MRKRNIPFLFRLNEQEAEAFRNRVKQSGLTQEAYVRQVISGKMPRDAPPPDYYAMMKELHRIGNNLNQIAQKAHVLNVIDVQRYDRDMKKFEETVLVLVYKCGQKKSNNLYYQIKEQRRCSTWRKTKNWC